MDERTRAWIDQSAAHLTDTVRRYGWFIQYVGGGTCAAPGCDCRPSDGPPFAYTVGLFGLDHPELLIFGVDPHTAGHVLNELGEQIRAGASLLPGHLMEVDDWPHRVIPEEVPNAEDIVFAANDYYSRPPDSPVPVLQLSYDDVEGRFPWEEGCKTAAAQPRPGTFRA